MVGLYKKTVLSKKNEQNKELEIKHVSVMLDEVMEGLNITKIKIMVDATLGLGGHSARALELNSGLRVVGFDVDERNLEIARQNLKEFEGRVDFVKANFFEMAERVRELGIKKVDGVLMDLGVSSVHFDDAERGFSLIRDGKLDMRLDLGLKKTAFEVINFYELSDLVKVFREYGEERYARKIAGAIVKRRKIKKFERTLELAEFIKEILVRNSKKLHRIHPATKVFQALRMEVNSELQVLEEGLIGAVDILREGGRIAVISFHSLEDRVVKNFMRNSAREYLNLPDINETIHLNAKLKLINKKPLQPTSEELGKNPRARSAKLRIAEKI